MSDSTEQLQAPTLRSIAQDLADNFNFKDAIPTLRHPRSKISYDIKSEIAALLPREAIACYRAACKDPVERKCPLVERQLYYEPFTYWDWHGLTKDEWENEGGRSKRRLIWEHRKGSKLAYPSGRWRWQAFKTALGEDSRRKKSVKRIAVSRWMTEEDLTWIVKELPDLEGLDLSDIDSDGKLGWDRLLEILQLINTPLLDTGLCVLLHRLLKKLKWLGISDWRRMKDCTPVLLLIEACTSLSTLSIRGPYEPDPDFYENVHEEVCEFISDLIKKASGTVHTIELRLSLPFLGLLLEQLQKKKPTVQRVGLDIGAWIQIFPLKESDDRFNVQASVQLERNAFIAARKARHHVYNKARQSVAHSMSIEDLPPSRRSIPPVGAKVVLPEVKYSETTDFYRERSGSRISLSARKPSGQSHPYCELDPTADHQQLRDNLERKRADTLNDMFRHTFDAGMRVKRSIKLFSLAAEPKSRSTVPLSPLSLLEQADDTSEPNSKSRQPKSAPNRRPSTNPDLAIIYGYIRDTFLWNPVIDWNWYMDFGKRTDGDRELLKRLKHYLQLLKNANIPIHLLISRRELPLSNLYWGWPYNEEDFGASVAQPIDHGLGSIAGLVDTLSVFYDLRNPLDRASLLGIDKLQPYRPSSQPERRSSLAGSPQKMANKSRLKKSNIRKSYARLASSSMHGAPAPGENADAHPSDDSDLEDDTSLEYARLHHVARRAAYYREALGWQRFWATYALSFRNLTKLRVRMPSSFDKIGSWRLAKLLNQKVGWDMLAYTDERQHIQIQQELDEQPDGKIWPAGKFVRRTWIWPEKKMVVEMNVTKTKGEITFVESSNWGDRTFTRADWEETKLLEDEQLDEAIKGAELAARREYEVEARLLSKSGAKKYVPPKFSKYSEFEILFRRQIDAYISELREMITDLNQQIEDFQPGPEGPDATLQYLTVRHQVLSRTIEELAAFPAPDLGVEGQDFMQTGLYGGDAPAWGVPVADELQGLYDEPCTADGTVDRSVEERLYEALTPVHERASPQLPSPENPIETTPTDQGKRKRSSTVSQTSAPPEKKSKSADRETRIPGLVVEDILGMLQPGETFTMPLTIEPPQPSISLQILPPSSIPGRPAIEVPTVVEPATETKLPAPSVPQVTVSPPESTRKPSLKRRKQSVAQPQASKSIEQQPAPLIQPPIDTPATDFTAPDVVITSNTRIVPPRISIESGPIKVHLSDAPPVADPPVSSPAEMAAPTSASTSSNTAKAASTPAKRGPEADRDAVGEPKTKRRKKTPTNTTYIDQPAPAEDEGADLSEGVPEDDELKKGKGKSKKKDDDDAKYKASKDDEDDEEEDNDEDKPKKARGTSRGRGRGRGSRGTTRGRGGKKTATTATTPSAAAVDETPEPPKAKGKGKKAAEEKDVEEGDAAAEPEKKVKTTKPRKKAEPKQEIVSPVARRTRAGVKKRKDGEGR
ncbi:hypothetical protein BDV96DRAFT_606747 [Lophiotrema nucula]|uniref:Uncharacterized protein n=1 Tax=Lophiotrema nucula TaxID=690887 RepID=A0A6A5YJ96_9PLEO|nr:hypothetical protein BDV96DRAFT_606747 [Lophiotrema nucula]